MNYAPLFRSGRIGKLELNNRLIMGAMGNSLADENGQVTSAMISYYRARAAGGVALVTTQCVSISREDMMPYSLALYDDGFVSGLEKLVRAIHEEGARISVQLMHPGMLLALLPALPEEMKIKVPSVIPMMTGVKSYTVIESGEIRKITEEFAAAAKLVMETGADAIEIHACHGCLLSTFLSPVTNRREDEYGGSVVNRARFTLEVISAVKEKTGHNFPLIVRMNGNDDLPGGVTIEEATAQADLMEKAGADAVSISAGLEYWTTLMAPPCSAPDGVNLPVAAAIKEKLSIPVITAGKITPELAVKAIEKQEADFIALGRPLLADPELPARLRDGQADELRRCVYCNNCLKMSWRSCTVNPFLYREDQLPLSSAGQPRKVMIAGGGIAGMQAAVLLAEKGHKVTLFEKESELGGQWLTASYLPEKTGYASFLTYLKHRLEALRVPVKTGTELTREMVLEQKPDVFVVAAGGVPKTPEIPGARDRNAVQGADVLRGRAKTVNPVIVIGGNMQAIEIAVFLARQGKQVTLVSHGRLGGRKGPEDTIAFRALVKEMVDYRVPVFVNVKPVEITCDSLIIEMEKENIHLPANTVVLATGVEPVTGLADELAGEDLEIFTIGDCVVPGNAAQATYSAARLVNEI